jgi:hypothetical protein
MKLLKICFVTTMVFIGAFVHAQTTNYQVYSLYVINIAKYSSWPSTAGELHVAVLGKSKVYDELLKHNGKNVNGHTMKVFTVENMNEIGNAHIVYLPDGKSGLLDDLLKQTAGKAVMIISEREGLHKRGAGFSFIVMDNGTLRFDMNNTELERRQIKVSKNLTAITNSSI